MSLYVTGNHVIDKDTRSLISKRYKSITISQATLNRLFRQYGETSFKSFLTKLRIEAATKILRTVPGISIKDVALEVGYNDQFYFSRVYKSFTGKNPSECVI